ncbi:2Fe-2S iron-sulfur cluster-binding protein [Colwellia demingiae]|uniref:2Fe-2S iron-sulfur cluster-binding protein n=1 Tax=Colwellia demingiae TaxID=89401 RepID=UPI001FE65BC3|nr:2Fe-2S iron-sulfur cluster-binding protein [Colwellia demingiae]
MITYYDPKTEPAVNQSADLSKDLGTPPSKSTVQVSVQIDGVNIVVPEGTSVLRAAAIADINIPKLCASDNLEAFGSCRLCAV